MRIAVIGDTHLGFKHGSELGEDAFVGAREAIEKSLAYQPDCMIFLGDIFDHRVEKPEVLNKAIGLFQELGKLIRSDHIVTIYGTHETRHKDAINPVQLLARAGLLKLLHKQHSIIEKAGQKVAIFGMSGVHDSFSKDELAKWAPRPLPGTYNILLLHQTFKEDIPQVEDAITYDDLPKKFDLYLFGHIHHQHESSISSAPILYTGSTVRTQLTKNTTSKLGFYVLDIDNNKLAKKEFISLNSPREFFRIEQDISNNSPAEIIKLLDSKITGVLNKGFDRRPLVKIKLIGKVKKGFSPSDLHLASLQKKFKDTCFLKIDKSKIESEQAKERLKFLANLGQEQKSIESLGVDLLCQKLKDENLSKSKLAELFEKLAEGELDAAESLLSEEKSERASERKSISSDATDKKPVSTASWQETFN